MFKLVIFDWSGTLLDDCEQTYRANVEVFRHYGLTAPSYGDYRNKISFPISAYYKAAGITAPFSEVVKVFYAHLGGHHSLNMFPHASELLHRLKHHGVKTALLTLQYPEALSEQLRVHQLEGYFDLLRPGSGDKRIAIHELLSKFHVRPEEILYVGDTTHDIEAGKAAGVRTGAITHGYEPREKLLAAGPDYVFGSLLEVEKLFE